MLANAFTTVKKYMLGHKTKQYCFQLCASAGDDNFIPVGGFGGKAICRAGLFSDWLEKKADGER